MIGYDTAVVALSHPSMCILCILVFENARFYKTTKRQLYFTYAFIIQATISEWTSMALSSALKWTIETNSVVTCLDYIFTPIVGASFALQISNIKEQKKYALIYVVLIANSVLEIVLRLPDECFTQIRRIAIIRDFRRTNYLSMLLYCSSAQESPYRKSETKISVHPVWSQRLVPFCFSFIIMNFPSIKAMIKWLTKKL